MIIEVGIDRRTETAQIEDAYLMDILLPNEHEAIAHYDQLIADAMAHPMGTDILENIVHSGEKIVIVTSDITRPLPSYQILPQLLAKLNATGIPDEDIMIVFALGAHRKHTEQEQIALVGEAIYRRIRCVDSDCEDVVLMGETISGTPVEITRIVAEADRRICIANIEYHYFAGYSGGAKPIMPGSSTRKAISANHCHMVEKGAITGNLVGNPVRTDLEEAITYCPIDYIINVVLDENKEIVHAVAGHFINAHRAGCRWLDRLYMKEIDSLADIVIVSQGGYPKDLNLYQTQKALDNAKHAVRDGGIIIVVGSCKEGMGEDVFEEWMLSAETPHDLIDRLARNFQLGGHKAAAIAMVLEKVRIYLVSDMDARYVRSIFLEPFSSLEAAYDAARAELGDTAKVLVMPYGGSTLPRLVK